MKTIAILQHAVHDGPGYFGTWLQARGLAFKVYRMFEGDLLPPHASAHAGWCILGGPMSANDPLPYFDDLLERICEAVAQDIPVIGHCLGGQLMARALGGTVQMSEHVEIGWSDLQVVHENGAQWFGPKAQVGTRLPLFQWHGESFSIPLGAQWLVQGRHCAHQAFSVGSKHLAMQFHCEVDEAKLRTWLELDAHELCGSASPGVQQAVEILPTLTRDIARSQAIANCVYARWTQGL
ncbi:MAG: type 1 glutamine amidotransferase [Candidatus Saccharibacteria bacterium]|nr:type 1 glutamine amidotransferase [Rhodoferax sp.]